MALIPGYEYDIFISYAHVDNIAFPGQSDGWIEQFYKNLNLMLARRYGRMDTVKIWWDSKKLDGSVLFDQSIESGIKESAIMICLNSPGYEASEYCQKELDTFYKKAQSESVGLSVGDRSRIIHVLLNNIPFDKWPKELSGASGFPFHDAREKSDFGDTVDTLSQEFKTQMQDLRDAVWSILNDFPKQEVNGTTPDASESDAQEDQFTVYLGEVADTLRSPRKRVIQELEKKGYRVITGAPPPDEVGAHDLATKEALTKSELSIHLLDQYPGREIVGAPDIWYPQKQAELSLQSGKSTMFWLPSDVDISAIEDSKYKSFIQDIESGKTKGNNLEFIRGSKSSLAQEIINHAEQLKAQLMVRKADGGKLAVLLDTHMNDQLYAFDLGKILIENKIQPYINSQEDDPRKNINLLGDRLSQVRKLIFMYGSVSKEWVLERMSAALQLIITNNYPIEDFFIYMAPPQKEPQSISLNQKFLKVNVINSSGDAVQDKESLNKFLTDLKSGAL